MKALILRKLQETEIEYNRELTNGSGQFASDRAKQLHGEIRALKWVLENWSNF